MRSVEVKGSSRVDATKKALKLLAAEIDEVKVEVIKEESRGILRWLGFKEVTVRVTIVEENVLEVGADIVRLILSYVPVPVESRLDVSKNLLNIRLDGEEIRRFQRKEDFAGGLGHIVELLINRRSKKNVKVRAFFAETDATGREKKLKQIANKAAEKVLTSGNPVELHPMTSWERRIIHLTLENNPRVYTESRGKENKRRVVVYPKSRDAEKQPEITKKRKKKKRQRGKSVSEKGTAEQNKVEKPPEGESNRTGGNGTRDRD